MAFSIVQSASTSAAGGASVAFSSSNTAGDSLIIVVGENVASDTFTITDSLGNVYISLAQITNVAPTGVWQVFYCLNCLAGANTVTASCATGAGTVILAVHEFSFLAAIDAQGNSSGSGASQSSGNITTNSASELLFAFTGGVGSRINAVSAGAGWTQAEKQASVTFFTITQWQITTVAGTYSSTTSATIGKGGSADWAAEIASFIIASGPPPPPPPPANIYDPLSSVTQTSFSGERGAGRGRMKLLGDMRRR